jgi:hypothetical protein
LHLPGRAIFSGLTLLSGSSLMIATGHSHPRIYLLGVERDLFVLERWAKGPRNSGCDRCLTRRGAPTYGDKPWPAVKFQFVGALSPP